MIGLNLCPFAKAVHIKNQIRYQVTQVSDTEGLLHHLVLELKHLAEADPKTTDTSLLIHPYVLENFLDYNSFLDVCDAALIELKLVGVLQIASFHPNYQFAGTQIDDVENYTNRSPYPMLHLLREKSIEKAIASYPDTDKIPEKNIELLKSLDAKSLKKLKSIL